LQACHRLRAGLPPGTVNGQRTNRFKPDSQLNETMTDQPFWKTKTLAEMSNAEWESLCDGCGLCCLNKLEDWDTGEIAFTSVACKLLDGDSCRCKDYENRQETVPDCIQLTLKGLREIQWLPPTCGYRLIDEGHDLYWWHPLVSGDPETVHQAGVSARGRTISEEGLDVEDLEDYVVDWPLKVGAERG
jgi:uncharacterized cysteine cluster protein YcgN (CxxCxxCC family)